jgi:hypothetical protein
MSEQFIKKNIKLSLEFGRYLSGNPVLFRKIPNKGILVFTIKGDKYFNKSSWSLAESAKASKSKVVEVQKQGSKWEIFSPVIV